MLGHAWISGSVMRSLAFTTKILLIRSLHSAVTFGLRGKVYWPARLRHTYATNMPPELQTDQVSGNRKLYRQWRRAGSALVCSCLARVRTLLRTLHHALANIHVDDLCIFPSIPWVVELRRPAGQSVQRSPWLCTYCATRKQG